MIDIKLSVIIPCYNVAETVGEQLEALSKQSWSHVWEVVAVDNGSTDNTMEIVEEYKNKLNNLRTVEAGKKKGVSYARNMGVEKSHGEYIVFTDADDVVGKNWLQCMGDALLKNDFVACRMEWARLNDFSEHTLQSKVQTDRLIDFSMVEFLPYGAGPTLGVKKSIHDEVGGFDEKLLRLQDLDYCWRIQLEGYILTFIPEAVLHKRARGTHVETFKQELKWAEYDVYIYEKYKHHGMSEFTFYQSIRLLSHVFRDWRKFFSPEKKELWMIRLGLHLGRLKGMIKYKYFKIEL